MKDDVTPIFFLIGAARSGTKFLRDTLAQSKKCLVIPYDINFVWKVGNETVPHDELTPDLLSNDSRNTIREKIYKLSKAREKQVNASFILEKSVSNTLRIPFILDVFPEAKFIHLIRNGYDVTQSSLRQWRRRPSYRYLLKKFIYFSGGSSNHFIFLIKNFVKGFLRGTHGGETWGPRYKGIYNDMINNPLEVICSKQWAICVDKAYKELQDIHTMNDRVFTIYYEELVSNEKFLINIMNFMNIEDKQNVLDYYRSNVVPHGLSKENLLPSLSNQVHEIIDPVHQIIGKY